MCWNIRRATKASVAWDYFREIAPDLALLQEVGSIPDDILSGFSYYSRAPHSKSGKDQRFHTVILYRLGEVTPISLTSKTAWVNDELDRFAGNLLAGKITVDSIKVNVVSVYSPAWPVDRQRLAGIDVSDIKLPQNPDVWVTELLWSALKDTPTEANWIVGGDLNSSETFDYLWRGGPRGNREILDRMTNLGLTEVLRHVKGQLVPTFRNSSNKRVLHQMDHLFVSRQLIGDCPACETGSAERVFGGGLSDHLPIVAEIGSGF